MVRKIVLSLIAVLGICAVCNGPEPAGFRYSYRCRRCSGGWSHSHGRRAGISVPRPGTNGTLFACSPCKRKTGRCRSSGMIRKRIAIAGQTNVAVTLKENAQAIDDVIVVAFGTTTKEAFTGSATVVKAEDIAKRQVSNVAQALAGAAAGVQVASSSGNPHLDTYGSHPRTLVDFCRRDSALCD